MNEEKVWYPQRIICRPSMDLAAANWAYDSRHEKRPYHDGTFPKDLADWAEHRSPAQPFHYRDGVKIWVHDEDLDPDDDFLGGVADEESVSPDAG